MRDPLPLIETGFLFLRHGESESNVDELIGGATNYALTEYGREQARVAGERLRGQEITAIYTSPLSRALDTARIVAEAMGGLTVAVHDDLRERNLGVWEGRPISEFIRGATPEGGETLQSFETRVLQSLAAIAAPPTVLLVAHAGVFRVLRQHLAGADVPERTQNAHPMVFEHRGDAGTWRVDAL
jgi:uncharacterized phosphatase